jgi:hypothetical protein
VLCAVCCVLCAVDSREGNETLFGFDVVPDSANLTSGSLIMGWVRWRPCVSNCSLRVSIAFHRKPPLWP